MLFSMMYLEILSALIKGPMSFSDEDIWTHLGLMRVLAALMRVLSALMRVLAALMMVLVDIINHGESLRNIISLREGL